MTTENMKRKSEKFANSIKILNYNIQTSLRGMVSISVHDTKKSDIHTSNYVAVRFLKVGKLPEGEYPTITNQEFKSYEKALSFAYDMVRSLQHMMNLCDRQKEV